VEKERTMQNKIRFLICALFLVALTGFQAAAETFQYRESVERKGEYTSNWTITERGSQIHLTVRIDDSVQRYICSSDGAVLEFGIVNDETDTDFIAVRNDNTVRVTGRINAVEVSKSFTVREVPWGQPIPILLQQRFKDTENGLDFWILNINKIKPMYLQAKRIGTEVIEVLNREVEAYHFEIRLKGALSAFWVSNYWLDKRTREFIKFKGDYGPGSPETVMQLMKKYE
jgi:hypothetical protein